MWHFIISKIEKKYDNRGNSVTLNTAANNMLMHVGYLILSSFNIANFITLICDCFFGVIG